MAYDFLGLTNGLLQRVNEVELTASNFSSTTGFHSSAKQYINSSINYINRKQYGWPWNHRTRDEVLVEGQSRYDYQSGTKVVDYDTFRIQRDDTFGNQTRRLKPVNYDEYVRRGYIDSEYNSDESVRGLPERVFKTKELKFGVWPPPDETYTLTFEYFISPDPLVAATDIPTIPDDFSDVIIDGGEYYTAYFRQDRELAADIKRKWDDDIDQMRGIYIAHVDDATDTRLTHSQKSSYSTLDLS